MIIIIITVAIQIVKHQIDITDATIIEIDHEDPFHHPTHPNQDQEQNLEKIKKEKTEKEKEAQAVAATTSQTVQVVNQNHHEKEED